MIRVVGDSDGAFVGLHDVLDQTETNAGAGDFGVAVATIEALENFGAFRSGDAWAGVGDDKLEGVWACGGCEGDDSGGGGEFEGVVEEVEEELADGEGIEIG